MSASVQSEVSIGEYSRIGDGRGEDLRRFRLARLSETFCLGPKVLSESRIGIVAGLSNYYGAEVYPEVA